MPFIQINQLAGMPLEQKQAAIKAVTEAYCEATGKNPSAVWVAVNEIPGEEWGVGGKPLR